MRSISGLLKSITTDGSHLVREVSLIFYSFHIVTPTHLTRFLSRPSRDATKFIHHHTPIVSRLIDTPPPLSSSSSRHNIIIITITITIIRIYTHKRNICANNHPRDRGCDTELKSYALFIPVVFAVFSCPSNVINNNMYI